MRPSLPPDMGDNAAAQATLEARLRREQVKRVSQVEDLSNVVGNATDGQALLYSQAKGAWQPGSAGIQGDYIDLHNVSVAVATATFTTVDMGVLAVQQSKGTSITVDNSGAPNPLVLHAAGYYHVEATVAFPTGGAPTVFYTEVGDQSSIDWFIGESRAPAPYLGSTWVTLASMYYFPDGGFGGGQTDFLRLKLYQNSGGSLNVNVTFKVVRLA